MTFHIRSIATARNGEVQAHVREEPFPVTPQRQFTDL